MPGEADTYKFALAAAEMASNTRAEEIVLLDLRGRSPVTEFFVIATGTSPRQMRTVAEEIQDLGKKMGFKAWQTSGMESARWILVDCVNVVAHIFDGEGRDFYDLELLWGDCPRIDWRKELGLPAEPEVASRVRTRTRFGKSAGADEMDTEDDDARLEGQDFEEEEGDEDEEDADDDAPIVTELPDESTGGVEFVEVDPPGKRRKRGRSLYPTPIKDEDEESGDRPVSLGGASQSLDEDDEEREAEERADGDVEGVSDEDLPRSRMVSRPMGGVSAGMSIEEEDEDPGRGATDFEKEAPPGRRAGRAKGAVVKKAASKKVAPKKVAVKKAAAVKKPAKKALLKRAKPVAKKSSGKATKSAKPKAAAKTKAKAKPKKKSKK